MADNIVLEILKDVALPAFTAFGGWFVAVWRSRQKREQDALANVKQILEMQKDYIAEQQAALMESKNMNKRLEAKLDKKNKSIRKANWCKYTNEGEGCPVLNEEERLEDSQDGCADCHLKSLKDDNGKA